MECNRYTPKEIGEDTIRFSIPLYQRLFEWEKPQIIQLLNDLKSSFDKDSNKPYYIGMFTVYKRNNGFDLVDGQQRFTVLMLMGIAFKWNKLLRLEGNNLRLSFFARKKDEQYLISMINENQYVDYKNSKMQTAIECIQDFVNKLNDEKTKFINYVFENLTFFISYLPEEYELHELNRYFEAMNATGRGLENHEILKVNLLKLLSIDKREDFTKIWNVVSDMDKPLIRQRFYDKEDIDNFHERQKRALEDINDNQKLFGHCNDKEKKPTDCYSNVKTIKEISPTNEPPAKQFRAVGERAILNFPEFLLQVLRLQLSEEEKDKIADFFNVHKLQETFQCLKTENEVEIFFKNLLKYRILLDYFIIRISNNDQSTSTYSLAIRENDVESYDREKLIKYQSMLYVSTTLNLWLTNAFIFLENEPQNINIVDFCNKLVELDNCRQLDYHRKMKANTKALKYGEINRYWFWRLDYYLWLNRNDHFNLDALKVTKNYEFRSNRSIEHIAPQNPKSNSNVRFEGDLLHCFGNMAMISSGQNSSLQNESFEMKKAHILSFIKNSKNGSVESLKMLKAFENENETWSKDRAMKHGIEMIDVLIDSFPENGYEEIHEFLEKNKFKE
jgi:hypothetical protein